MTIKSIVKPPTPAILDSALATDAAAASSCAEAAKNGLDRHLQEARLAVATRRAAQERLSAEAAQTRTVVAAERVRFQHD